MINFAEQYYQGVTSFERFTKVMDIQPDIKDTPDAIILDHVSGRIDLSNISFTYDSDENIVLSEINMSFPAGTSTAIVGESGAGKITTYCGQTAGVFKGVYDGRDIRYC